MNKVACVFLFSHVFVFPFLLFLFSSSLSEPMRALRGLIATDVQSRQLSLQWENLAFNLTRCHTYSVSLCYRYTTAGGGGGHNTTVRECLAVEHNASRFTLRDLPPYHSIHVRLSLANPEGKKEGREVTFQTDEDSKSLEQVTEKNENKDRTCQWKTFPDKIQTWQYLHVLPRLFYS